MPEEPRLSSLSTSWTLSRVAWSAGTTPAMSAETTVVAATNASTGPSTLMTIQNGGSVAAMALLKSRTPTHAMAMPSSAPTPASTSDSVSSCATIRRRLAPRAVRIATSLVREAARASSRFATLEQAMSSTPNTAPIIVQSIRVGSSPMADSVNGIMSGATPSFSLGCSCAMRRLVAARSWSACA